MEDKNPFYIPGDLDNDTGDVPRRIIYETSDETTKKTKDRKYGPIEIIITVCLVILVTILMGYISVTSYNIARTKYIERKTSYERAGKKTFAEDKPEDDKKPKDKEAEKGENDKKKATEKPRRIEDDPGLEELKLEEVEGNAGSQNQINKSPRYQGMQNYEYSYYYVVPEHFVQVNNEYYAPDNTAKINYYAAANDGVTSTEALNSFISAIGGTVTYSAKGSDWFAVTVEKDGVIYYRKGFTDQYIREFTFVYPSVYTDVYDGYINVIEDNFKRTDR